MEQPDRPAGAVMGAHGPRGGGRRAALPTIKPEGPEARAVAVRAAHGSTRMLSFTADPLSREISRPRAKPRAALPFRFADEALRVRGRAAIREGLDAEDPWRCIPTESRMNFGGHPATGRAISGPDAFSQSPDGDRFAPLDLPARAIDMVALRGDGHRRALWRVESDRVVRLAPRGHDIGGRRAYTTVPT